jgi:hypothetical protein
VQHAAAGRAAEAGLWLPGTALLIRAAADQDPR